MLDPISHDWNQSQLSDHRLEAGGFDSRLRARPKRALKEDRLTPCLAQKLAHTVRGRVVAASTYWKWSPGRRGLQTQEWTVIEESQPLCRLSQAPCKCGWLARQYLRRVNIEFLRRHAIVKVFIITLICTCVSCDRNPESVAKQNDQPIHRIRAYPSLVSLGVLRPGEPGRGTFSLRNDSKLVVIVDHVESTCPCVAISPLPIRIASKKTVNMEVLFEPQEESDFRGSLSVELSGKGSGSEILFRMRVELSVVGVGSRS